MLAEYSQHATVKHVMNSKGSYSGVTSELRLLLHVPREVGICNLHCGRQANVSHLESGVIFLMRVSEDQ